VSIYLRDLAERVIVTFVGAFVATLIAGDWFTIAGVQDVSTLGAAGLAGAAAVLSLIKGVVATAVGAKDSASLVR